MRDPQIERKIRFSVLFLDNWKKLHAMMAHSLNRSTSDISISQEKEFTDLRSYLLEEFEYILDQIGLGGDTTMRTRQVLTAGASLSHYRQLDRESSRKLENQWNDVFTKVETALGKLKLEKSELARKPSIQVWFERILKRLAPTR
jgi:hypothetical protein